MDTPGNQLYELSVQCFPDAGLSSDSGLPCYIGGHLVGSLRSHSIFHVISWSSHKGRYALKETGAAQTLAAGKATDIENSNMRLYENLFGI